MGTSMFEKYDLNRKVEELVKCYKLEISRPPCSFNDISQYHAPREFRDFIESVAVCAELVWPRVYGINISGSSNMPNHMKAGGWDYFKEVYRTQVDRFPFHVPALYRIIERGGNRAGPRRGVIFAEKFNLDANIPLAYAIDWSDPHLFNFLKANTVKIDPKTKCPVNYFARSSDKMEDVTEITLGDAVSKLYRDHLFAESKIPTRSQSCENS